MVLLCKRCKQWKHDEEYTYKTKQGYFYLYCDSCRDKLTTYRDETVKQNIKEQKKSTTTQIDCECGKKITLHGNADYYIRRHLGSKYHITRVGSPTGRVRLPERSCFAGLTEDGNQTSS